MIRFPATYTSDASTSDATKTLVYRYGNTTLSEIKWDDYVGVQILSIVSKKKALTTLKKSVDEITESFKAFFADKESPPPMLPITILLREEKSIILSSTVLFLVWDHFVKHVQLNGDIEYDTFLSEVLKSIPEVTPPLIDAAIAFILLEFRDYEGTAFEAARKLFYEYRTTSVIYRRGAPRLSLHSTVYNVRSLLNSVRKFSQNFQEFSISTLGNLRRHLNVFISPNALFRSDIRSSGKKARITVPLTAPMAFERVSKFIEETGYKGKEGIRFSVQAPFLNKNMVQKAAEYNIAEYHQVIVNPAYLGSFQFHTIKAPLSVELSHSRNSIAYFIKHNAETPQLIRLSTDAMQDVSRKDIQLKRLHIHSGRIGLHFEPGSTDPLMFFHSAVQSSTQPGFTYVMTFQEFKTIRSSELKPINTVHRTSSASSTSRISTEMFLPHGDLVHDSLYTAPMKFISGFLQQMYIKSRLFTYIRTALKRNERSKLLLRSWAFYAAMFPIKIHGSIPQTSAEDNIEPSPPLKRVESVMSPTFKTSPIYVLLNKLANVKEIVDRRIAVSNLVKTVYSIIKVMDSLDRESDSTIYSYILMAVVRNWFALDTNVAKLNPLKLSSPKLATEIGEPEMTLSMISPVSIMKDAVTEVEEIFGLKFSDLSDLSEYAQGILKDQEVTSKLSDNFNLDHIFDEGNDYSPIQSLDDDARRRIAYTALSFRATKIAKADRAAYKVLIKSSGTVPRTQDQPKLNLKSNNVMKASIALCSLPLILSDICYYYLDSIKTHGGSLLSAIRKTSKKALDKAFDSPELKYLVDMPVFTSANTVLQVTNDIYQLGWKGDASADEFIGKVFKSRVPKGQARLSGETLRTIYRAMNFHRRMAMSGGKTKPLEDWTEFASKNPDEFKEFATQAISHIIKASRPASVIALTYAQFNIGRFASTNLRPKISYLFGVLSKLYANTTPRNLKIKETNNAVVFSMDLSYELISQHSTRMVKVGTTTGVELRNWRHPQYLDLSEKSNSYLSVAVRGMFKEPVAELPKSLDYLLDFDTDEITDEALQDIDDIDDLEGMDIEF